MIKFGIQLPQKPVDLVLNSAIYADKLGFDSIFTPDHLVGIGLKNWDAFEAFTLLAAISQHVRIPIGTCVSDVLRKNPAVVAQSAITLDWLHNSEVVLGLGAGEGMNLVPYGISTKHLASKLEEGAKIIRDLIDGKVVNFSGKFFRMHNAFLPKPKKKIHLWIAGNQRKTAEIVSRYADGWVPTASMGPKKYKELLEFIKNKAPRPVTPALFAYIVIDKNADKARELIEIPAKFISLLSPTRDQFLERVGIDVDFPDLFKFTFSKESVKRVLEVAKLLPFDLIEDRFIFGNPEQVIERLYDFVQAGVEHFVLSPLVQHNKYIETLKLISKDVIPYFRQY